MCYIKFKIVLLSLLVFRLCTFAQPVVDFSRLDESLQNNARTDVITEYNQLCKQASEAEFRNETFEKLLEYSRQLSRLGYSEQVYNNLEKLSGENQVLTKFSKKFFSSFFNELGYAYYQNNKFEKADSVFGLTVKLKGLFPEVSNLDVAFSLNYLGLTQRRLGNYQKAIEYLEKAKSIRIEELGENHQLVGAIYNNIGLVYNNSGDYDNAFFNFREAIRIKQMADDVTIYSNYFNLGVLSGILGNYTEALNYYKKTEELLLGSDNQLILADVYMNSGGILNTLKATREALQYYQKALIIYTSYLGEQHKKTADVYQNLSGVYDELGEHEKSLQSFRKALLINEDLFGKNNIELAPLFNNYGLLVQKKGNFNESLQYFQRAREIYSRSNNPLSESHLNTLVNTGDAFTRLSLSDSAKYYYTLAADNLEYRFGGKHPLLAHVCNNLASIYFNEKNITQAEKYISKAFVANVVKINRVFVVNQTSLDPSYLFDSYLIQGQIEASKSTEGNNRSNAFTYFYKADSVLSVQRNFLFSQDDKIDLAKNSKRLTEAVLQVFTANKRLSADEYNMAFQFMEKSKNLVLLQSINEKNGKNFAGIPADVLKSEEELLGRINFLEHQVRISTDSLLAENFRNRLFEQKQQYKKLVEKLEENYPRYFKLRYQEYIPEIENIQNLLGMETAMLSYFVTEVAVFRLIITRENIELDKIKTGELEDHLVGMRKGITLKLDDVYLEKASVLGELLIPKYFAETIKKLVIIPDGGLSVLPFEALLPNNTGVKATFENHNYLAKRFRISYSPSVSIWENLVLNKGATSEKTNFLAFAPVFEHFFTSQITSKPDYKLFSDLLYNSGINSLGVSPLTASKKEVLKLDSLFSSSKYETNVFLMSDASEKKIYQLNLDNFKYIHIATHGFVDKNNPDLSGLLLAPVNQKDFDNILYTGEIYNLSFNAELITLSACETGLGQVAEGEGLLGFSRAFFYSGAKNLLLSLWKVNDSSTEKLMTDFYSNVLKGNMDYPDALFQAKKHLMNDKTYSHPYYWAPFVLIGS